MPATITWNGNGRISTADVNTETWNALKISGSGGGPSPAAADGALQGVNAVTCTVNKQRVALYFDIGVGNELDFSGGGAEVNQMIYIWASFLAPALLNSQSTGGLGIFLETLTPSSTQYHLYYYYGSDNYAGGWKRLVLDPTKTASASSGTAIDLTSVRYIGIFADVGTATLRFDNLICDAIDVGTGLTITGTSTTDDLIGDLLADEKTNRYGIITSLNDSDSSYGLGGELVLGDTTAATNSTLTDIDKKLFLEEPLYYQASIVASVPLSYFGISCVGGTGTNSITIGKKVGIGDTANGRSGWSVIGNTTYDLAFDFDDGNVNTSKWYGCSLENITGTISFGTNTSNEFIGNSVTSCSQIDLGSVIIRNCNFINTSDIDSALIWNENINIQNSNFIANTVGAAIEHPSAAGTPYTYTNLSFSGNTFDGLNSSGTDITVANSGTSNASTDEGANIITYESTVDVGLSGVTEGTAVKIIADETVGTITKGDIIFSGFADSTGEAKTTTFNYEGTFDPSGLDVIVRARNSGIGVAVIAEENAVSFTDETTEGNSSTTGDMTLLPATPSTDDAYYFGSYEKFSKLKLNISTVLTQSSPPTFVWEYWNGAWVSLSNVLDGTNGLETIAGNIVSWTMPSDWTTTTINSQGPLYYMRYRLSVVGTITQVPIGTKVTLDTIKYLPYIASRTIVSGTGLADIATWTEDTIAQLT